MNVAMALAGRFRVIRKDDKQLVVFLFGDLEKKMVKQVHVDYICRFYNTPTTEEWLLEGAKNEHGFYLIVKKGD
jgi:hypothetical protein